MRVLHVVTSDQRRGAEVEAIELARQLADHGHHTQVVALAPSGGSRPLQVAVLGVSSLGPATLGELRRRGSTVDVVIAHGSRTLPACALAFFGTRTRWVYRSIGDPAAWAGRRWRQRRTGLLMRRACHVVALWPAASEAIGALYGVPPERRSVISNLRDPEHFRPATADERDAARRALGIAPQARVVAWIGAMSAEKDPVRALDVLAELDSEWVLVMAGEGPLADDVRAVGAPRVIMVGMIEDTRAVLHAADVLLCTSRTEGVPGVLIEAALCGLPVVATDVGGVSSVVGAGPHLVPVDASPSVIAAEVSSVRGPARRDTEQTLDVVHAWESLLGHLERPPAEP